MRHVSRDSAYRHHVRPSAKVLKDERHLVVYCQDGVLNVLRLIEIPSGCEDCHSAWVAQMDFSMSLEQIVERSK